MRNFMFFLFLTCVPYLAFGSNNNNNEDWFKPTNMFVSVPKKTETNNNNNNIINNNEDWFKPTSMFSSNMPKKTETNNNNSSNGSKKTETNNNNDNYQTKKEKNDGHYPKYPMSINTPKDCKVLDIAWGSENNLLITVEGKQSKKCMYNIPTVEWEKTPVYLAKEGNLSIKFHTFEGRKLDVNESLEISTYMPPYLCSIGGLATIKFGETIEVPKRDIQFINFKLNTDEKSAIGLVDGDGKNFQFTTMQKNNSRVRHLNYRAGLIEMDQLNVKFKNIGIPNTIYLHVWFKEGIYRYGHCYDARNPEEPN